MRLTLKQIRNTIGAFVLTLCFLSCSSLPVTDRADPRFDFSQVSTFSPARYSTLAGPSGTESRLIQKNPFFVQQIQKIVTSILLEKGWKLSPENPNLAVTFRTEVSYVPNKSAAQPPIGPTAKLPPSRIYGQRNLVFEVVETSSHHVVWTGSAQRISPVFYESEGTAEKIIKQIFANFPENVSNP